MVPGLPVHFSDFQDGFGISAGTQCGWGFYGESGNSASKRTRNVLNFTLVKNHNLDIAHVFAFAKDV
jgi:hypothetical protein